MPLIFDTSVSRKASSLDDFSDLKHRLTDRFDRGLGSSSDRNFSL